MHAHEREYIEDVVKIIIGAAYEVSNNLGAGFLEKVYERALTIELKEKGFKVETQVPVPVKYKGHDIGNYVADMIVGKKVLVELKCVDAFTGTHTAQCINYLRASGLSLCLLFNFQKPKVEWRRVVHKF